MRSVAHAGRLRRYHTWPVHHQQTVGEHSWRVALIYDEIFESTLEIMRWILKHDLDELWSGDLPWPVKRNYRNVAEALTEVERDARRALGIATPDFGVLTINRIKICDILEMAEFGLIELRMGNQYCIPIYEDCRALAWKMAGTLPEGNQRRVHQWMEERLA